MVSKDDGDAQQLKRRMLVQILDHLVFDFSSRAEAAYHSVEAIASGFDPSAKSRYDSMPLDSEGQTANIEEPQPNG